MIRIALYGDQHHLPARLADGPLPLFSFLRRRLGVLEIAVRKRPSPAACRQLWADRKET